MLYRLILCLIFHVLKKLSELTLNIAELVLDIADSALDIADSALDIADSALDICYGSGVSSNLNIKAEL